MKETYRLAGRTVEIRSRFSAVHVLCRDYRAEGTPDFSVETDAADIALEREKSAREDALAGVPPRRFSDGYLESLAVCRRIAERLLDYDTVLFHGSCVAVDGIGYLFTAKSGTGKSTHTRLWREMLGSRAMMVNDDKPLIRMTEEGATIYGAPWDGKHRLSTNLAVPLQALYLLERAEENAIRPVTKREAYPMLLQQVYRPMDPAALAKTLTVLDRLAGQVSLWRLGCNKEPEAARVAYEALKGSKP